MLAPCNDRCMKTKRKVFFTAIVCRTTSSVLRSRCGLHHTCPVNHYFREWGKRWLVGLAGVALRLHGEALQSGETCVRDSQDTVVHRGLVVEASLVGSQGSALGHTVVLTSSMYIVCGMFSQTRSLIDMYR